MCKLKTCVRLMCKYETATTDVETPFVAVEGCVCVLINAARRVGGFTCTLPCCKLCLPKYKTNIQDNNIQGHNKTSTSYATVTKQDTVGDPWKETEDRNAQITTNFNTHSKTETAY